MTSFQSSELTELPVVENSQLFAQRAHSARYAPLKSVTKTGLSAEREGVFLWREMHETQITMAPSIDASKKKKPFLLRNVPRTSLDAWKQHQFSVFFFLPVCATRVPLHACTLRHRYTTPMLSVSVHIASCQPLVCCSNPVPDNYPPHPL